LHYGCDAEWGSFEIYKAEGRRPVGELMADMNQADYARCTRRMKLSCFHAAGAAGEKTLLD